MAYEMMQTRHADASSRFRSLDDIYYYGGQNGHDQQAVISHRGRNNKELDLRVGDRIGVAGNHWDGWSKGLNKRTVHPGLYPSFKVQDVVDVAEMPTYPQANNNNNNNNNNDDDT